MDQKTIQNAERTTFQTCMISNVQESHGLYEQLKRWDLEVVKRYVVEKEIFPHDLIEQAVDEYRKFLAISLAHPDRDVPISEQVDKFWHAHILFTENYTDMGEEIVGAYIHHRPAILDNIEGLEKSFGGDTMRLYHDCFGNSDTFFWSSACCKRCTCHCKSGKVVIR